jgi:hypothetical protein
MTNTIPKLGIKYAKIEHIDGVTIATTLNPQHKQKDLFNKTGSHNGYIYVGEANVKKTEGTFYPQYGGWTYAENGWIGFETNHTDSRPYMDKKWVIRELISWAREYPELSGYDVQKLTNDLLMYINPHNYTFFECFHGKTIHKGFEFPEGFGDNVREMHGMFSETNLKGDLAFPEGFGVKAKDLRYMFSSATVREIVFPDGFGQSATHAVNMFVNADLHGDVDWGGTVFADLGNLKVGDMFDRTVFNDHKIYVANEDIRQKFITDGGAPEDAIVVRERLGSKSIQEAKAVQEQLEKAKKIQRKFDTSKMEKFEKEIMGALDWFDLATPETLEDIKQAVIAGDSDRLQGYDDYEFIGAKVYDSLWDYLEATKGIQYIKKLHKNNIADGMLYVAIAEEAAQITAQHILARLEQEND